MFGRALHRFERFSAARVGVVMITLVLVVGVALFQKTKIMTILEPGDDIKVAFARDYQLRSHVTKVKVAGVRVGLVTGLDHEEDGTVVATLHLEPGIQERLGEDPGAAIRPTTLLGGNYYVELTPGGDPGTTESIPAERTTTPVELDRVLEVLKPEVRRSTQRTVGRLDSLLGREGRTAVRGIVHDAPATLRPAAPVLRALRGRDARDLTTLVSTLDGTARALADDPVQLDRVLVGLADTSAALADSAPQVSQAVADLPDTLGTTRAGLRALRTTLGELRDVSDDAIPTARELSAALTALDPALVETAPLLRDLRPALADLRPTMDDLVPSAVDGLTILDDVNGATIERVKGPIVDMVNSDWHGSGDYAHGGNDSSFYHELGDLIAGMNNASRMTDHNGSTIHFQPGFGVGSISGTPISFEQLVMELAYPGGAP
jgi:phospholipid/cholesterol/gamma-HCH transport system substrate-binding protein